MFCFLFSILSLFLSLTLVTLASLLFIKKAVHCLRAWARLVPSLWNALPHNFPWASLASCTFLLTERLSERTFLAT